MDFQAAQQDCNRAFVHGAPGVAVSAAVWLAAGWFWQTMGVERAFLVLFFGGMAIYPLSLAIAKIGFRAPPADPSNPLIKLGMDSTFALIAAIVIAYVLLMRDPALAIPVFAAIMGTRYLIFRTVYGSGLFLVLGGAIAIAGLAGLFGRTLPLGNLAWHVGVIELVAAAVLFARRKA